MLAEGEVKKGIIHSDGTGVYFNKNKKQSHNSVSI